MALGTTMAVLLGAAVAGGTTAAVSAISKNASDKANKKVEGQTDAAARAAQQQAAAAAAEDAKQTKARQALLGQSTAGFGPNTNLARSFLTSL